jgi:hypothetical protein
MIDTLTKYFLIGIAQISSFMGVPQVLRVAITTLPPLSASARIGDCIFGWGIRGQPDWWLLYTVHGNFSNSKLDSAKTLTISTQQSEISKTSIQLSVVVFIYFFYVEAVST